MTGYYLKLSIKTFQNLHFDFIFWSLYTIKASNKYGNPFNFHRNEIFQYAIECNLFDFLESTLKCVVINYFKNAHTNCVHFRSFEILNTISVQHKIVSIK